MLIWIHDSMMYRMRMIIKKMIQGMTGMKREQQTIQISNDSEEEERTMDMTFAIPIQKVAFVIPIVPYIEVILGSLLIAGFAMIPVVIASIAALSSFTVLLARRLIAGDRPPCACLSFRSTKPIGYSNIVRNLLMLALLVGAAVR